MCGMQLTLVMQDNFDRDLTACRPLKEKQLIKRSRQCYEKGLFGLLQVHGARPLSCD